MSLENLEKLKDLIGSNVRVNFEAGDSIEGFWRTNLVNAQTGEVRLLIQLDSATITIPLKSVKQIEQI